MQEIENNFFGKPNIESIKIPIFNIHLGILHLFTVLFILNYMPIFSIYYLHINIILIYYRIRTIYYLRQIFRFRSLAFFKIVKNV